MDFEENADQPLLLATGNTGKIRELRHLLAGARNVGHTPGDGRTWEGEVVGLERFPGIEPAVESADTFAGNAALKAVHYAARTGLLTLADDSGLAVDALGGAPGVYSARYAGENADAAANNRKLMDAVASTPVSARSARFCCAMALAIRGELLLTTYGVWEGQITCEPRGSNGFGYDPHFFVPSRGMTAAELPPEIKNEISHRGRALHSILPQLFELLLRC